MRASVRIAVLCVLWALCAGPAHAWHWRGPAFEVTDREVREGPGAAWVRDATHLGSNYHGLRIRTVPRMAGLPVLDTDNELLALLHRLALQESVLDIRPDGAFMAGAKWPGVWTRDIAYASHLSLALLHPHAARLSLLAKTFDGRVRQDTGTGGAWPVSTDRVVWTMAAWEVYLATGDRGWLADLYEIGSGMAEEDRRVAWDAASGLFRGESSFMDWREQTYPAWMDPVAIFGTRCLGTNVVHAQACAVLAAAATELGRPASEARHWQDRQATLGAAIRHGFTDPATGGLAAFLYPEPDGGRSGQREALGTALAVLFDVVDGTRASRALGSYPLHPFGAPTIHPQLPHPLHPYHNRSVWPFVQAYFGLAAQRAGSLATFESMLAVMMRAAALFQTNAENLVLETGGPDGTVINSDRQLWSVAGFLAMVHRGLFGVHLETGGLGFHPAVPRGLAGRLVLRGLVVRGAILDIEVRGWGLAVRSLAVDGVAMTASGTIPYPAGGHHRILVQMDGIERTDPVGPSAPGPVARRRVVTVPVVVAPPPPHDLRVEPAGPGALRIVWRRAEDRSPLSYVVARGAAVIGSTTGTELTDTAAGPRDPHAYVVWAVAPDGSESVHSPPVISAAPGTPRSIPVSQARVQGVQQATDADVDATDRIERWGAPGGHVRFVAEVPAQDDYLVRIRYANGSGPLNTDSRCGLRSLAVDGRRAGPLVMPQRGLDAWDELGLSSPVRVRLGPGRHTLEVYADELDATMDPEHNVVSIADLVLERAPR